MKVRFPRLRSCVYTVEKELPLELLYFYSDLSSTRDGINTVQSYLKVTYLKEEPHRFLCALIELNAVLPYLIHARSTNLYLKTASRPPLWVPSHLRHSMIL